MEACFFLGGVQKGYSLWVAGSGSPPGSDSEAPGLTPHGSAHMETLRGPGEGSLEDWTWKSFIFKIDQERGMRHLSRSFGC